MLKKRRKPRRTIDEGLKNLFSQSNSSSAAERETGHTSSRRKQPVSSNSLFLWSLWSLFLLCASLSSLHGHVCPPHLPKIPWSWTKQVPCACTLSACSACWYGRAGDGRRERSDAGARAPGGEERWDTTAKQPSGTKRPGQAEGFPFPCDAWMKMLEISMQMPPSNVAFAVRGSGPDSTEASACGQHWRLGHVDLPTHLRPLQHNLLGGIQARRTHRAVQAQLITKVQPGLSQPYSLFFRPWTNKLYPEYTLVTFPLNTNDQCKKMQSCSSVDLRSLAILCFPYPRVHIHKAANWQRWIYLAFPLNVTNFTLHGSSLTNLFRTALSNSRYPLFWFLGKS